MKIFITLLICLLNITLSAQSAFPYQTNGEFKSSINSNLNTLNQRIDSVANMLPKETHYKPDYSSAYASTAILGYTFYVLQKTGSFIDPNKRDQIALTGMLTSVGTYFLLNHIKNRYRHHCIDKQSSNLNINYGLINQTYRRQSSYRTTTLSSARLFNRTGKELIFKAFQTTRFCSNNSQRLYPITSRW